MKGIETTMCISYRLILALAIIQAAVVPVYAQRGGEEAGEQREEAENAERERIIGDLAYKLELEGIKLLRSKDFRGAIERLKHAATLYEEIGDTNSAARLMSKIALAYDAQGKDKKVLKRTQKALQLYKKSRPSIPPQAGGKRRVPDENANIGQLYLEISEHSNKGEKHRRNIKKKVHDPDEEQPTTDFISIVLKRQEMIKGIDRSKDRLDEYPKHSGKTSTNRRIAVATLFTVLSCLFIYSSHLRSKARYEKAHHLLEAKEYNKAIPLYKKLVSKHSNKEYVKMAEKELLWNIFLLNDAKVPKDTPPPKDLAVTALRSKDRIIRGSAIKILGANGCNDVKLFTNIYINDADPWVRDCAELELLNIGFRTLEASNSFGREIQRWWSAQLRNLRRRNNHGELEQTDDQRGNRANGYPCMVYVPPGEFIMGDKETHRTVHVDAFYIDKYPVTNAQYRVFLKATGHREPKYWDNDRFNKDSHPVVGVTFDDALAYAKWIGKRLPTQEEWEKAARGIYGWQWPWGNSFDKNRCNTRESEIMLTTPVGIYPKGVSPYGCYDMAGNVAEWTDSGPMEGIKAIRGGYWNALQMLTRCASMLNVARNHSSTSVGFRCALSVSRLSIQPTRNRACLC